MSNVCLCDSLSRYLGQTVTVFTASGGLSGSGFTGVLSYVGNDCIKLITDIGAPPACPIGSSCTNYGFNGYGYASGYGYGGYNNGGYYNPQSLLGSVAEIPTCQIVCFTHNSI